MPEAVPGGGRRRFLGAAGGLLVLKSPTVFGSQANSAVEIGIVGCGGRGTWIGDLFQEFGGARIAALADVFPSQIAASKAKLKADSARAYTGLEGYQELAASKLDAVVIETPPYFHPEQAAAAVAAGKHVYLAKPAAVDVAGCRSILDSARKAQGKASFFVDFQFRARPVYQECVSRVHGGDLGVTALAEFSYITGKIRPRDTAGLTAAQARLRNWVFDKALSGDIIVEQNIHAIDAGVWLLNAQPVKASGTGGRKIRTEVGDCWDHFQVTYWFPGDVRTMFFSTQCTRGLGGIRAALYGADGAAEMIYNRTASITGTKPWKGPDKDDTFRGGAIDNIRVFLDAVRAGRILNNAEESIRSNLTSILGRMAAYKHGTVSWDEMMRSNEKIDGRLAGIA